MMGFVLELKNEYSNSNFYRYRINNTVFWFSQNLETGNIYHVSVRDEKYPDIEFYVDDYIEGKGSENKFYPTQVRFRLPHQTIKSYKDENEFNYMFQYLCLVRSSLQGFFESSEHAKLYWEKHKEVE